MLKITIILIFIFFSNFIYANNTLLDGNFFYTIPDASSTDDFHTGKIVTLNYNYYYLPWLALTSGLFISEEIFDEVKRDIVGTYQASIETQGFTLGLRPEYKFSKRNKAYMRAGFLLYKTKLKVAEYFEPGLTTGESRQSTDGNGYFLTLGWAHSFSEKVSFQLELNTQKQLALFSDMTNAANVFDLDYTGFSIGIGYAF